MVCPAQTAMYFKVGDLQATFETAKLGPPKSASEGAERDLTWPCTVPKQDGVVLSVDGNRICTEFDSGRKQTYSLNGKIAYVSTGDRFTGLESIIAGTVPAPVRPATRLQNTWSPLDLLSSSIDIDRYAATKALPFYEAIPITDRISALESGLDIETDERVSLEMGASLARMNSARGFDTIISKIANPGIDFIPMEGVFILTEIADRQSLMELQRIATAREYFGNEIRPAAVWGIGKAGAKAYDSLIQFLDDHEDDVVLHAIAGFDTDTPNNVIGSLINLLVTGNDRQRGAVCEALRLIDNEYVINQLIQAAEQNPDNASWMIAALGQLSPNSVRNALQNNPLLSRVQPFFHMSKQENWLASDEKITDLRFLISQDII